MRLVLISGLEDAGKTDHVKCFCGKLATQQLELEEDNIATPIAYFCDIHAQEVSSKHNIKIIDVRR